MNQKGRNVVARESRLSLQDLLERYCIERLLYRLSLSEHRSRFVLKGALLLIVWGEGASDRVTRDADLLGFGDNFPERLEAAFREICAVEVGDDGVRFEIASVAAEQIRAEQEYVGVRVAIRARVGNARIPVQADIGFDDAFTLEPEEIEFPSLLDLPRPVLRAYTKETALSEKFEAMVNLGERNSRMKDFFDVWLLAQRFDFQGARLSRAIAATFARRVAAAGEKGAMEMLQWTAAGCGQRFVLIVHPTDAGREWAYDRTSHIGKLDHAGTKPLSKAGLSSA